MATTALMRAKGIGHGADQRAIAQAYECRRVQARDRAPGLIFGQHRRLAGPDDMLGPAHRLGRVDGEDSANDEPIEQHADRREVLLHGRLRGQRLQLLDVGCNIKGLDVGEFADAVLLEAKNEHTAR